MAGGRTGAGRSRSLALVLALGAALPLAGCAATAPGAVRAPAGSRPALDGPTGGPATPADAAAPGAWTTDAGAPPVQSAIRRARDAHGPRHVMLLLGHREFDDDWKPLESQTVGGIVFDEMNPQTGHGIVVGINFSEDDARTLDKAYGAGLADVEMESFELTIGWRRTFRHDEEGLHPYVSAGGAALRTTYDVSVGGFDRSEDDIVPGLYVGGGLLWDLDARSRLGVDYRYTVFDDLEFGAASFDTSHSQLVLMYGWAF